MKVNVMSKGDFVLNVTDDFVAVQRANGEVDILPLVKDSKGIWVDLEHPVTIAYAGR